MTDDEAVGDPGTTPIVRAPISGNDLAAIEEIWLQTCPSCDAGLPYICTHPGKDYRPVIAALVDEIEVLRAAVQHLLTNSTTPASKDQS